MLKGPETETRRVSVLVGDLHDAAISASTQLIAAVLFMAIKAAEAASLSEALCFPTIAAFDSGNLRPVAMALHEKYPQKPIVIAGATTLWRPSAQEARTPVPLHHPPGD